MKINKVVCDGCNTEITIENEIRLDVMKKEVNSMGYSKGFRKQKSIDLCQNCYEKLYRKMGG